MTTTTAPHTTAENGQTQTTAVEVRRVQYQPIAPIGSAGGLKSLLEAMRDSIAQALPRHVTPERLIKTMLVAANRNPDLLKCTQASVLETINRAAELGLDLSGTLGEAYPVPFNNRIKYRDQAGAEREMWAMQCTLIIGYRGLEKLAWQSGEVSMIDAEVVYENDHFLFRKGFDPKLEFEPKIDGDRGKPIGAYACIITKGGGRMARFMPVSDIEKIRQGAKSANSPAWKNHWDEMARKTALRRVLKDAPLSTEKLVKALEQDDRDYGLANVLEAETAGRPEGPRSRALLENLRSEAAPGVPDGVDSASEPDDPLAGTTPTDGAAQETGPAGEPSDGEPAAAGEVVDHASDAGMFDRPQARGRRR